MDFLTLAGYVVAALAMALGLYLILRKNVAAEPTEIAADDGTSATATLENTAEQAHSRNIAVVPRHARDQLEASAAASSAPLSSNTPATRTHSSDTAQLADDEDDDLLSQMPQMTAARLERGIEDDFNQPSDQTYHQHIDDVKSTPSATTQHLAHTPEKSAEAAQGNAATHRDAAPYPDENSILMQQARQLAESSKPDHDMGSDPFDQALAQLEAATTPDSSDTPQHPEPASQSRRIVETAAVEEWQGESALLDAHIEDQERRDDESALAQAEHIMALYVMPNASRALSGERIMHLLRQFGLRYGEMSLFHRFEDSDGTGPLMFSVLRYTSEGPSGFDLETLPTEQVEGLAFFLALPSKHAVAGYDTMVSISTLLAREIHGQVFDEHMNQLSPQLRDHYRHFVLEYRKPN